MKVLFPIGSYFTDTDAYIDATSMGLAVSYRQLGYSNFISFFHAIFRSDTVLIFAQYLSNVIANLFLFFTLLYFFPLKKTYRVVLFVLLMCNPLYVLYSNFVLSDAFFASLSVIWFTVLLWIMYQPRWLYFFIQLLLLYWLFLLRYNALIYPFMVAVAYLLSKQAAWKKMVSIGSTFLLIIVMIVSIIYKTEDATGIATFSAFGGWQMANNAMFPLKHVKLDSAEFNTKTSKEICVFIKNFYDSLKMNNHFNADTIVNTRYIWYDWSPLKRYMEYYFPQYYAAHPPDKNSNRYAIFKRYYLSWEPKKGPVYLLKKVQPVYRITAWTTMGPIFSEFGAEVIKKYPLEYLRYYILPNITVYFHPPVELLERYNEDSVKLRRAEVNYYDYSSNKVDQSHSALLYVLMDPWSWLFTIINILFLLLVAAYYFTRSYKNDAWFNRCLVFYSAFYLLYALFNIVGSPTLFRYYFAIVTLSVAFIIYLWQRVFSAKKK